MARPVDEMVVVRLIQGDPVRARPVERAEAVLLLTSDGLSAREIAERLRVGERCVTRHRVKLRAAERLQTHPLAH